MTNRSPSEEASSTPPGKKKSTRTAVACKSCHGLKVKCTPADERNPSGPCLRCFNAKRKCEVDYSHSRKKKKKHDASPAPESALNYSDHQSLDTDAHFNGNANIIAKQEETIARLTEQVRILKQQTSSSATRSPIGISPLISETESLGFVLKSDLESELAVLAQSNTNLNELAHKLKETADRRNSLLHDGYKKDVVSQGYMTIEEASKRMDLYNTKMFPQHPHVVVPAVTEVDAFRIEQPILFNCVMSVTNSVHPGPIDQDLALTIENIAAMGVSIEVMVTGTKSVELIKCLVLLSLWYNNPEMFRNRRYHILNILSVTLLHDLGIVAKPQECFVGSDKDPLNEGYAGSANTEYRRLVMTLYSITVSFCLILRRSIFVKWTPFVEKCCAELESSTDERWREFAVFSRLNHQLDRIHNIVHAPEVSERDYNPSVYIVHEMQNVLASIKSKLSKSNHAYRAYYYSVEAYLHEPILSQVLIYDSNSATDVHLNEKAVKLIVNCTTACLNSIQEFNQLRIEELAAIPLCYASRIIYTAGMLLRLRYLILSLPSHIEKDLVPRKAIQVIQKLNDNFAEASLLHPLNHFLKKTRLVLQLFIQTYVSQVNDILQKNGGTPQNFKPVDPRAREEMESLVTKPHVGGLITTASGAPYKSQVPIDYLLYAASYKENNPNATILENRYAPESNTRENNSANGTPNTGANVPRSNTNITPPVGIETQLPYFPKSTGAIPISHNMTFSPRHMDRLSGQLNYPQNQSETERLSDSFGALNDEFWGDLISNDSNRVNFTNSNANQFNDEVFFMH
ncbi:Transcriptional regulator WAR1 [Meyerozyma sp. JA9]|nr:Transcriptional regulator WAR1 [Meyerozyma sp. JA9]